MADTDITIGPDGTATIPVTHLNVIKSALLWARLGADQLAKDCEALAGAADAPNMEHRLTHLRNATYHRERSNRIAAAELSLCQAEARARFAADLAQSQRRGATATRRT